MAMIITNLVKPKVAAEWELLLKKLVSAPWVGTCAIKLLQSTIDFEG
jgi:hypothetical protein